MVEQPCRTTFSLMTNQVTCMSCSNTVDNWALELMCGYRWRHFHKNIILKLPLWGNGLTHDAFLGTGSGGQRKRREKKVGMRMRMKSRCTGQTFAEVKKLKRTFQWDTSERVREGKRPRNHWCVSSGARLLYHWSMALAELHVSERKTVKCWVASEVTVEAETILSAFWFISRFIVHVAVPCLSNIRRLSPLGQSLQQSLSMTSPTTLVALLMQLVILFCLFLRISTLAASNVKP